MSAPEHRDQPEQGGEFRDPRRHHPMYWVIGGVAVVLLVIGLITYSHERKDKAAEDKASQLTTLLESAGLTVPADQDVLISVLGDDGGAICDDPNAALNKAMLDGTLTNGAATVGMRPITVDERVVAGELAVLAVYCPDQVDDFTDFLEDKDYDSTLRD